ncbi:MAG: hypothetical protein IGR92_15215 [Leptolyngbyaceae cyanobacterium T60_A2020_046]|nr:hypothetical protein [Leptolyngbyaceae cyanobacterium T60_A2020_046]
MQRAQHQNIKGRRQSLLGIAVGALLGISFGEVVAARSPAATDTDPRDRTAMPAAPSSPALDDPSAIAPHPRLAHAAHQPSPELQDTLPPLAQTPSRSGADRSPTLPSPPQTASPVPLDPELGVIHVRPPEPDTQSPAATDPELGVLRVRDPDATSDPELGSLRVRPVIPEPELPEPQPQPSVFLSTYVSALSSDNVFLVEDPILGRFSDNLVRPGLALIATPPIGPQTSVIAAVEVNFPRYLDFSSASYDELRFQAGLRHRFSPRVYGQLGWSQQRLYRPGLSDRFFKRDGIELFLGRRDPLTRQLAINTYYQGQLFFAAPEEFSSTVQSLGTYLSYELGPQWNVGLGYQLSFVEFTEVSRSEFYQRAIAQLSYNITPNVRASLFGGVSFGNSSEPQITYDDTFFGISINATFGLF